jgi:hypothetical protein
MRTLLLTSPEMTGPDVTAVQRRLGVAADGVYGEKTAAAVKAWRWRTGFPRALPGIGPDGQRILLGLDPLPADYRARAAERAAVKPPMQERAVSVMEHWARLGLVEQPAGSNRVPRLGELANSLNLPAWYGRMGWPWCAFSAFLSAHAVGGATAKLGFAGKFNVLYCPAILDAARKGLHGMQVVPTTSAKRGDLAIFNFDGGAVDHIGRIRLAPSGGMVATVEGNTSSGDGGSQNNGGGVYIRSRSLSLITAFVRDS